MPPKVLGSKEDLRRLRKRLVHPRRTLGELLTWLGLTSPVAAIQLAAGAFCSAKMATQDLTSPVAANQLAAGAFFSMKMTAQDLTSPVAAIQLAAGCYPPAGVQGGP